jgi:hypothetical protein
MPTGVAPFWSEAWARAMSDPWRWILEAAGLAYLIWLWFAAGLNQKPARDDFLKTGRIPQLVSQDA